jgi:hypothetical protein
VLVIVVKLLKEYYNKLRKYLYCGEKRLDIKNIMKTAKRSGNFSTYYSVSVIPRGIESFKMYFVTESSF